MQKLLRDDLDATNLGEELRGVVNALAEEETGWASLMDVGNTIVVKDPDFRTNLKKYGFTKISALLKASGLFEFQTRSVCRKGKVKAQSYMRDKEFLVERERGEGSGQGEGAGLVLGKIDVVERAGEESSGAMSEHGEAGEDYTGEEDEEDWEDVETLGEDYSEEEGVEKAEKASINYMDEHDVDVGEASGEEYEDAENIEYGEESDKEDNGEEAGDERWLIP
jgi:hypothetical protein